MGRIIVKIVHTVFYLIASSKTLLQIMLPGAMQTILAWCRVRIQSIFQTYL
jgi:hypothetical protein